MDSFLPSFFTSDEPLMEAKKAKIFATSAVVGVLILLIILWLCLGFSTAFYIITGIGSVAILTIFVWILIQYGASDRRMMSMVRRSALEGEELRLEYSFLRKVAGVPTKFRYEVLEAATDNFQAMLGQGSSASVFKGILDDGTPIAVKRIEGVEHGDREFRSEVSAIASVQHMNLVRLLGYCFRTGGPRYIVYEFVPNGSLDNWIFPRREREGKNCLPWELRYQVAIDVAKALAYLHHDCRSKVLHLDVKPENILLDERFRALVSDFGLSKLMGKDVSRVVSTVRGTRGYLAPEWLLDSGISEKSDIYSYGMVLLELVGGRRNVRLIGDGSQRKWSYFPRIVSEKVREGRIMEVVDERLMRKAERVEESQVRTLVYVALWCIQEQAKLRPSMARVVDMLEGRMAVDDPPPETDMLIMDLLSIDQVTSHGLAGAHGGESSAVNEQPATSCYSFAMSTISGR